MDIDLLSKMVKELILDNDKVALPGLGSFVAEIVPSTFSDKGYTINPPYRRLYFRSRISEGDELVSFYAKTNNVDMEIAERVLTDFLTELKSVLFQKKTVVFPGLGRMRATKENTIFFVADEDLDIYPDGFALESISLKAHKETPEEVSGVMSELKAYIAEKPSETEDGPLDLDLPVVPEVQPDLEPEPVSQEEFEAQVEPEPVLQVEPESEPEPVIQESNEVIQQPEPEDSVMKSETESVAPETTPMSVASAPEAETAPETKPDTEGTEEPKTVAETVVAAEIEPEAKPKKKRRPGKIFLIIFLSLLITAVLLLVAFILVSRFCPELLDSILYSAEELEVINYRNQ